MLIEGMSCAGGSLLDCNKWNLNTAVSCYVHHFYHLCAVNVVNGCLSIASGSVNCGEARRDLGRGWEVGCKKRKAPKFYLIHCVIYLSIISVFW